MTHQCPKCRVLYGKGPCRACETARDFKAQPLPQGMSWRLINEIQDIAGTPAEESEMFARLRKRLSRFGKWADWVAQGRPDTHGEW